MQRNCWRRRGPQLRNKPTLVLNGKLSLASFAQGRELHQPRVEQDGLGDAQLLLLAKAQQEGVDAVAALGHHDGLSVADVDPTDGHVTLIQTVARLAVRACCVDFGGFEIGRAHV